MASLSEIEQFTSDLDWYAVDRDGWIGQFLTAGALLPGSLASDKESFDQLSTYFDSLPESGESIFCPKFVVHCRGHHVSQDPADQMPFAQSMSRRGLYSFDRNDNEDFYYRVAIPSQRLNIADLPGPIARIL